MLFVVNVYFSDLLSLFTLFLFNQDKKWSKSAISFCCDKCNDGIVSLHHAKAMRSNIQQKCLRQLWKAFKNRKVVLQITDVIDKYITQYWAYQSSHVYLVQCDWLTSICAQLNIQAERKAALVSLLDVVVDCGWIRRTLLDNGTRRSWSDFLISACLVFFFEEQPHEFSYRFCDDKTQDETQSEDGHDESLFKSEVCDSALNPAGTSLVETDDVSSLRWNVSFCASFLSLLWWLKSSLLPRRYVVVQPKPF